MTSQIFAHCVVCDTCGKDARDMRASLERQGRRIAGMQLQLETHKQLEARLQELERAAREWIHGEDCAGYESGVRCDCAIANVMAAITPNIRLYVDPDSGKTSRIRTEQTKEIHDPR